MSKFKRGDEVRFLAGSHEGRVGIVVIASYQISQSDWPEVKVSLGFGEFGFAFEEFLEFAVDRYEYAAKRTSIANPGLSLIVGSYWADRADRERFVKDMQECQTRDRYSLVRRLKAGPVEEV